MSYAPQHAKPKRPWKAVTIAAGALAAIGVTMGLVLSGGSTPPVAATREVPTAGVPSVAPSVQPRGTAKPPVATVVPAPTYTVKQGDTLWTVAASKLGAGTDWTKLASANHLSASSVLTPGEVLKL